MQIQLDPDIESIVNQWITSGDYASPGEFVNKSLRLFLDPAELHRRHDELKALIREGVESAQRGELYDADEVFEDVLRDLEKAIARSK
jgi:putative addiction module CopG family antidote